MRLREKRRLKAAAEAVSKAKESSKPADKPKAEPETKPAAKSTVDYPTLQKAVFELAGKGDAGKAACIEVAKSFGFDNFKAMKEAENGASHFEAALAAVRAKLDELAVA